MGDDKNVTRRAFLGGGLLALGAVLTSNVVWAEPKNSGNMPGRTRYPRENVITPPGSESYDAFKRHCTGCLRCVGACKNRVLGIRMDALRPTISYEHGFCAPTCTACGNVCPTGAIRPVTAKQRTTLQIGHAVWRSDLCLNTQTAKVCRACVGACPNGAIDFVASTNAVGNKCLVPSVNVEMCIGCGACELVCHARPLAAIHVEGNKLHINI